MDGKERRHHNRYRLWLPARIEGAGKESRLAIGHDLSQKGSLLVTDCQLEVGKTIQMFLRVPPDFEAEREIRAVVIRCSNNQKDPEGLWPFQIAVEFEDADPGLERLLREHSVVLESLTDESEQTR
ncbi:MAG: PilZ domain-containing protein [Deltaproteobacteria bacterium]|nr:PilZ domain-containing protein [Deltaproteobacteria bacterium]